VREVMDRDVYTVDPTHLIYEVLREGSPDRRQRLYPVLHSHVHLVGLLPWSAVLAGREDPVRRAHEAMFVPLAIAYRDEIRRAVADRMAAHGIDVIPWWNAAIPITSKASSLSSTSFRLVRSCSKRKAAPNGY
jgi:hypothetical protein